MMFSEETTVQHFVTETTGEAIDTVIDDKEFVHTIERRDLKVRIHQEDGVFTVILEDIIRFQGPVQDSKAEGLIKIMDVIDGAEKIVEVCTDFFRNMVELNGNWHWPGSSSDWWQVFVGVFKK
jgi:hypothetical protein